MSGGFLSSLCRRFDVFQICHPRRGWPLSIVAASLHLRPVYLQLIIFQPLTRFAAFADGNRGKSFASTLFHFRSFRSCIVCYIARPVNPCIIDHRGIVDDCNIVGIVDIIVVDVCSSKIPVPHKCPLTGRHIIAIAVGDVNADSRSDGRPSVIAS